MIKFSKICATALALAMSVTFVTPTTALAAKKVSTETELGRVGNNTERVNTDIKIRTYSGATYNEAQAALVKAGLAEGWLKTSETSKFYNEIQLYNGTDYDDYYYPAGYEIKSTWKYSGTYPDEQEEKLVYTVKLTEYVNANTGKRSTDASEVYSNDEAAQAKFVSGVRIKNGETTYLAVPLRNGDVNIKNIKSSKKKIVKAKRFTKKDNVTLTNDNLHHYYDSNDKYAGLKSEEVDGKTVYYFYTSTGEKVVLADDYEKDAKYLTTTSSSAIVYIKLTPGKTGKSKLSFDIVNDQGVVTGKVSTTVYVMNDTDALKTFTYAGKSLLDDYSNSKNLNYGKRATDSMYDVSTAKSGKLVVKANSTYKIVKIEVGKLYTEAYTSEMAEESGYSYGYTYNGSGKTVTHKVDLNGDGDTDDTINGISESGVTYKYSTVKSGKKIKLSTVGLDQATVKEIKSRTDNTGKPYDENAAGAAVTAKSTNNAYTLYAPTHIKVTVYDKLNKTYTQIPRTIWRVVKK